MSHDYLVSLAHIAPCAGRAAQFILWQKLRAVAPVGHISMADARAQANRLRLPAEAIFPGVAIFWTVDTPNDRLFLHSPQRAADELKRVLPPGSIAGAYSGGQVTIRDRRNGAADQCVGVLTHMFLPGYTPGYRVADTAGHEITFVSAEIGRIDLAPGVPVFYLHAAGRIVVDSRPVLEIVIDPEPVYIFGRS